MSRPRFSLALLWPAGLVVLVGVLAFFQYKWLGQVADADRARQRASLDVHAREFANDFDREISRAYFMLQLNLGDGEDAGAKDFAKKYALWHDAARFPQLISNIYLSGADALMKFDPASGTFSSAPWPEKFGDVRERLKTLVQHLDTPASASAMFRFVSLPLAPIFSNVPALLIPVTNARHFSSETALPEGVSSASAIRDVFNFSADGRYIIVELDQRAIVETLLPALADKYFTADDYHLQVIDTKSRTPLYSRGLGPNASITEKSADATTLLFAVRSDSMRDAIALIRPTSGTFSTGTGATAGSLSIMIDQRSVTEAKLQTERMAIGSSARPTTPGNATFGAGGSATIGQTGAWQLVLRHPAGSLDAAIAHVRRRNLGISFGVLAVLSVSVVLISVSSQRAQRLAAQQMDFVATVSHELRTPLAVIRSAAQNLSAGVVHDAGQAKRYGDLIDAEGRRLTEMVEQVLEYAGISGGHRSIATAPTDIGAVTLDVLASCDELIKRAEFHVDVTVEPDLPHVNLDENAYRRALSNLIANALKYGGDGRWMGVSVKRAAASSIHSGAVHVSVSDRGRGIEAADVVHIFEAFYRGQYAKEQQIHGNGLGLSLVKHIAEAHGGRVSVQTAPGAGAAFTLSFPT